MDRLLSAIRRNRLVAVVAYLFAWTVPGLISATQLMMSYSLRGDAAPMRLLVQITFPTWYAWALLCPAIWWAARRFPLDGARWLPALPIHLALNASLMVASAALVLGARALFGLPAMRAPRAEVIGSLNTSLLAYWTVVLVAHAVRYREDLQRRAVREAELAARLSEARLEALRAQLDPHFLFNTMNAISAFVHQDPDTAERMLGELGELLRMVLDQSGAQVVPLRRELAFVDRYLSIQKARLGNRLSTAVAVPDELGDIPVPAMLLQPLVENAVEHGIARRRGPGSLRLWAARDATGLVLEVEDDGPGLAGASNRPPAWRVGLRNTRERLAQLYGPAHTFEVVEREPHGVVARVRIPIRPGEGSGG